MVSRPLRKVELVVSLKSVAKRQAGMRWVQSSRDAGWISFDLWVSLTTEDNQYGGEVLGWDEQEESE